MKMGNVYVSSYLFSCLHCVFGGGGKQLVESGIVQEVRDTWKKIG